MFKNWLLQNSSHKMYINGKWPMDIDRCYNWRVKDQQMHHSFNVFVLNILLHVSAFQNAIIRESNMNMIRWYPLSWKAEKDGSCILWQTAYSVCHNMQLPSFSAFHKCADNYFLCCWYLCLAVEVVFLVVLSRSVAALYFSTLCSYTLG
jgi:hypothetical protein